MDRRIFLRYLALSAAAAPSAAFARTGGSLQRQQIEVIVHKDPG